MINPITQQTPTKRPNVPYAGDRGSSLFYPQVRSDPCSVPFLALNNRRKHRLIPWPAQIYKHTIYPDRNARSDAASSPAFEDFIWPALLLSAPIGVSPLCCRFLSNFKIKHARYSKVYPDWQTWSLLPSVIRDNIVNVFTLILELLLESKG